MEPRKRRLGVAGPRTVAAGSSARPGARQRVRSAAPRRRSMCSASAISPGGAMPLRWSRRSALAIHHGALLTRKRAAASLAAALASTVSPVARARRRAVRSPSSPVVTLAIDHKRFLDLEQEIGELVAKVRDGRLHPDPADRQDCAICDYRRLCRMYGS